MLFCNSTYMFFKVTFRGILMNYDKVERRSYDVSSLCVFVFRGVCLYVWATVALKIHNLLFVCMRFIIEVLVWNYSNTLHFLTLSGVQEGHWVHSFVQKKYLIFRKWNISRAGSIRNFKISSTFFVINPTNPNLSIPILFWNYEEKVIGCLSFL